MREPSNPGAAASSSVPGPSPDQQRFWERYFVVYDTLNEAPPYQHMVARAVELLAPTADDRILDAGAGTGNISKALAVSGARIVGIDFCVPALDRCRAKVPSAEFLFGDLTGPLPFESSAFDKVACCLVLHFLEPDRQSFACGELFRVLRPGGRLAVTVFAPGLNPLRVYAESLRELSRTRGLGQATKLAVTYLFNTLRILYYQWRMRRGEQTGQYRYFTREDLRRTLEQQGFQVVLIEPAMANQCWTAAAIKPAGAGNGPSPA